MASRDGGVWRRISGIGAVWLLALWAGPAAAAERGNPERSTLEAAAAEVLAMSDADWRARVPEQTPFISCDCPACGRYHLPRGLDGALWKFSPPDRITCRHCGTSFPNDQFPLNDQQTLLNTLGEAVTVRFHRDRAGKRFALPGVIDSWRNGWLIEKMKVLAQLFALTGEERYARPVAVVLDRYAQVFPHYLVKQFDQQHVTQDGKALIQQYYSYVSTGGPWKVNGRTVGTKPAEPQASNERTSTPYGWTQSRWGWGRWGDELPLPLVEIYHSVKRSAAFEQLSAQVGYDVRRRLMDDLFGNAVAYLREYPFWFHITNNAGRQVGDIVRAGRMLEQPDWVHFGYRWSREVIEKYHFTREGGFVESPGYFHVFLAAVGPNFATLDGYSDPPGYVGTDGLHLENVGSDQSKQFLAKTLATQETLRFPNGGLPPLEDNRHDDFVEPLFRVGNLPAQARERSENLLLPAYGHAILGAGSGDRQVQAHLHFSNFTQVVHAHEDALSLMLWAFGTELFTDVGYHKSQYRAYGKSTLSHNTVVVDRRTQAGADTKGNVLFYEPALAGLSFIQVEDRGAYEGVTERYRRTLLLNARDTDAPYVVDVFEVRGGSLHDYVLHGPTLFESDAVASVPLSPMAGQRPLLLPGETWSPSEAAPHYGVFTDVAEAKVTQPFAVTYTVRDPYSLPVYHAVERWRASQSFHYEVDPAGYPGRQSIGVRTHVVPEADGLQVLLGRSLSLTRSGLQTGPLLEKITRPSLLLRRTAAAPGLRSVFIAVHEPFYGAPRIQAVRRVRAREHGEASVIVEIQTSHRTDTLVLSLEGPQTIEVNDLELRGVAGFIEQPNAGATRGALIAGTTLRRGRFALSAPTAAYRGTIVGVTSRWNGDSANAFYTDAILPAEAGAKGSWLIAEWSESGVTEAFAVDSVERRGGQTRIVLADESGLRMKDGRFEEIFYPRRRFSGEMRFTFYTHRESAPVPVAVGAHP